MPIRSLIYFTAILSDMLSGRGGDGKEKKLGRNLYGRKLIKIPVPHFIVFYNGEENQPDVQELKLSDSYEKHTDNPQLELTCMVYNINNGKNPHIRESCKWLDEYMIFVNKVREFHCGRTDEDLVIDIEMAIDYCIEHNILKEFLISRRNEVTKNMKLDYTFDRQLELEREDAREEGLEEGRKEGREDGQDHIYEVIPLLPVSKNGNLYTFKATSGIFNAGSFKQAFRMYPKNALLPHRQDFCYVRWF